MLCDYNRVRQQESFVNNGQNWGNEKGRSMHMPLSASGNSLATKLLLGVIFAVSVVGILTFLVIVSAGPIEHIDEVGTTEDYTNLENTGKVSNVDVISSLLIPRGEAWRSAIILCSIKLLSYSANLANLVYGVMCTPRVFQALGHKGWENIGARLQTCVVGGIVLAVTNWASFILDAYVEISMHDRF